MLLTIYGYCEEKIDVGRHWDLRIKNLIHHPPLGRGEGSSKYYTCLTLPNLGFLWVFFKYPKISKKGNPLFFPVVPLSYTPTREIPDLYQVTVYLFSQRNMERKFDAIFSFLFIGSPNECWQHRCHTCVVLNVLEVRIEGFSCCPQLNISLNSTFEGASL